MLQRAASNAYSWWWASHVRTKQSKWLEQSLQDMGDKVETVLKLITQDGDSFAKRAEMYYKHRPELINFVEESFRAYQSLAERFDHISKELQNANSTLASAFPDQFQYQMDDDNDDYSSPRMPRKFQIEKPPPNTNIPKAPKKFPTKNIKALMALTNPKKTPSKVEPDKVQKSGMTKSEALAEIDKLQKQILTFQTEKEFAKSSYESGYAKYWNIEEEINGMQERISKLQDEFGISQAIDDDEARTLMAEAAIKSCQDTLAQLQEKQEKGAEEAKAERQRITEFRDRLRTLKGELSNEDQTEENWRSFNDEAEVLEESNDMEMFRDKIMEHFDVNTCNSLTVSEMAEKIDELVSKVINLETAVSSQTALIHTLKSETDELQTHIKSLEDDKANLIEGKHDLSVKMSEMENKLKGLHDLDCSFQQHDRNLKTHFTETRTNLETISKKLHDVKPDEEFEKSSQSPDYGKITEVADGKTELEKNINEKDMNLTIITQTEDGDGNAQARLNFESLTPSNVSDSQTQIQPSLEESKPTALLISQAEEPFKGEVEELVNYPQETQQQLTTLSSNEPLTPQEIQLEEKPGAKVEETVIPQVTQQQSTTLSVNELITPQEVQSEEAPNNEPKETANSQVTQQQPTNISINEPITLQEVQSEPNSKTDEPESHQGTKQQQATVSTSELGSLHEVQSEEKPYCKADEPVNSQGTELATPKEAHSEETPNSKSEEPVIPQGSRQQSTTLLTNEHITPQVLKIESTSVPQVEPVTLEEVLRRESVSETNDWSNSPSSVERQGQARKEEDEPDWQQLFMNGLDGKEQVLLTAYTNTLRNYKEAKKRLGEIEKKSQLDVTGIASQLRELRNYNAMKDQEIQFLRQKLNAVQRKLEESKNAKEEIDIAPFRNEDSSPPPPRDEEDIRVPAFDTDEISPAEAKLRADIDEILEENLDFWMRFSASFGQIQKFQNGVKDLFSELAKLTKNKEVKEGNSHGTAHQSLKSDIRPIYKHLREIGTELTVWLEQSEKLKEELQRRFSQLCNIQEEIKHAVNDGAADDDMKFTSYNAAKFQGEVANMLQENNKVADELQAGMDHISGLQVEVANTITRLNEDVGFSGTKSQNENQLRSGSKGRVPLRSFIFGVKQQKKKQSIFSLMHPAMTNRRYQQLKPDNSP